VIDRPCKQCGKAFRVYASSQRVFCSSDCRAIHAPSALRHGKSRTRLHGIWCHMKTRCRCTTSNVFSYYGGRGISVCDEWKSSFETFASWAASTGYNENLELDRIDVNGNYEPSNCRWATRTQQMSNTRKRRDGITSKYKGVSWCRNVGKWRVQIQHDRKPMHGGLFTDEVAAARRYDELALRIHGEYCNLNFPRKESASF